MTRCKKLLFVKNAKAGSTSVAKLIIHYSTGKLVDKPHQRQDGVFSGFASSVEFGAAFKSPDTYCFTMVREPAARLQSAFLNLFVDGRVASITGQARSTLTRENGQPTDSNLAQPSSVILLRARTPICASVF